MQRGYTPDYTLCSQRRDRKAISVYRWQSKHFPGSPYCSICKGKVPPPAVPLKHGERHTLYCLAHRGNHWVIKRSTSSNRHLRSLRTRLAALENAGQAGLVAPPLALQELTWGRHLIRSSLVYQYIPGQPLSAFMNKQGRLQEPHLTAAVARLVVALERYGLMIGDLSAENLIVPAAADGRELVAIDHEALLLGAPDAARQSRALAKLRLSKEQREQLRNHYNSYGACRIGALRAWIDVNLRLPLRDINQHPAWRSARRLMRGQPQQANGKEKL